ncbi:GIY-YIG nuclease family protein [Spiroplasma sp. BIUS-1]|uniref:GIY-YIG nuclease family protein n=1 Tax=Spiroplasma sp. BIUS-1 TaxID=216964 RepID=UPI001399483C|nr:GIY-YIG nuclease family protein [Spiroplasma sp. BIUS-1]QHX37031.1 GIY-YIG nuclease family protein [Spiroplasma sp. BIUS-1]
MNLKLQYKLVYKIKNSRDPRLKSFSEEYIINRISKFKKTRTVLNYEDVKLINDKVPGTYLIYSLTNGKLAFCYVGESTNVFERFKQHINGFRNGKDRLYSKMRKKVKELEDISFMVLDEIEDQNERLKKETYYIYTMKSKFFSLNSKLVNRRLRCPSGHGMVRSFMTYDKEAEKLNLIVYGRCVNKHCNITFVIK